MKLHHFAVAAALAVVGVQSFAARQSESFTTDPQSSTFAFSVKDITAGTSTFSFTLDTSKGATAGVYDISGTVSGGNFSFSSITLNSQPWDLTVNNKGKALFGEVALTSALPLTLTFTGTQFGAAKGAFSGQLLLTPVAAVPEPETYALMLAGLGAVGLIAFRRRSM